MKRKIVFWGIEDRPSSVMRGRQVAEAIARTGRETETRIGRSSLRDLRDAVVVAVKNGVPLSVRRRNRVVFDCIDFDPLGAAHGMPFCAAILAPTRAMASRLRPWVPSSIPIEVVYHHADPRIRPNVVGDAGLRLVYVGESTNSAYLHGEIPELSLLDFRTPAWLDELRNYNAHFSARLDRTKSVVKLANAATSCAMYVGAREPGCVELLGEDYPFFLTDHRDLSAVREDLRRFADEVGTPRWRDAAERLEFVRSRLALDRIVEDYLRVVDSLP